MNFNDARAMALQLMEQHGLLAQGWSFGWNRAKTYCGMCFYSQRRIVLSVHFASRNAEEVVRDTVLHEIAHAIVGPGHGHDRHWKLTAIMLGAKPRRCKAAADMSVVVALLPASEVV